MRLHGTAQQILSTIAQTHPEVEAALERIEVRIKRKPRREIERYQAACIYALASQFNFAGARILEIGTAHGYSAAVIAEAAPLAEIVTLNPDLEEAAIARQNLGPWENVTVETVTSLDYLHEHADQTWHFIFVDGDHARVRLDLPYFDHLVEGGLMLLHDWSPEGTWRACVPVYEAANDFAAWLGRSDVEVVDDQGVGMIGFSRQPGDPYWYDAGDPPADVLAEAMAESIIDGTRLTRMWHAARITRDVPGAVVSLGCGHGGAAALLYHAAGGNRPVWLFDTFEGIPAPGDKDGEKAIAKWQAKRDAGEKWLAFDEARARATWERLNTDGGIVKGDVVETVGPAAAQIGPIAILHLDMDWYLPTRIALLTLLDQVQPGGIVIVDDYGHWEGARNATDKVRLKRGITAPLQTLDYTARWWRVP